LICPDCGNEMGNPVDTTYSNMKTERAEIGQQTGDIYKCETCELFWIDDFLSNVGLRVWHG